MLKRITERFATKSSTDMERLNDYGYIPCVEEIDEPELGWDALSKRRRDFNFEGDF